MNRYPAKRVINQNGFTLIEILLVMMITTILAAGINASYRQVSNVSRDIEQQREIYQQSRDLVGTLRDELAGLYTPAATDANSNQALFLLSVTNNSQELTFFTMMPAWNQTAACGKMAKVTYSFKKTSEAALLSRSEQLYSSEKAIGKESSQVIDEKLDSFDIQVTDSFNSNKDSWQKTYNSKASVPKAVKIQLRYRNAKKQTYTDFSTTVAIKYEN